MARYTVVLTPDVDGGFVVTVPALPGCVTQGDTREEALANAREAITLYIEDCVASGDPVPSEDSREYVDIRLSA
ncbi:MAG: type II toxin-antitoxin system HicB family antitoxin [Phycisphaerales bacterium]